MSNPTQSGLDTKCQVSGSDFSVITPWLITKLCRILPTGIFLMIKMIYLYFLNFTWKPVGR